MFGVRTLESLGVVCVILCLAVLIQCRLVSDRHADRRSDGQTLNYSIYRASIASRGKKSFPFRK